MTKKFWTISALAVAMLLGCGDDSGSNANGDNTFSGNPSGTHSADVLDHAYASYPIVVNKENKTLTTFRGDCSYTGGTLSWSQEEDDFNFYDIKKDTLYLYNYDWETEGPDTTYAFLFYGGRNSIEGTWFFTGCQKEFDEESKRTHKECVSSEDVQYFTIGEDGTGYSKVNFSNNINFILKKAEPCNIIDMISEEDADDCAIKMRTIRYKDGYRFYDEKTGRYTLVGNSIQVNNDIEINSITRTSAKIKYKTYDIGVKAYIEYPTDFTYQYIVEVTYGGKTCSLIKEYANLTQETCVEANISSLNVENEDFYSNNRDDFNVCMMGLGLPLER